MFFCYYLNYMSEGESFLPQTLAAETNPIIQSPETSKLPIRFREWLQVIAHTHSKLSGPEILTEEDLKNYQDGQLTTQKLAEILAALGKREGGFFLVDSDHAAHSLREYHPKLFPSENEGQVRETRRQAFQKENLQKTKEFLSKVILKRAEAIRALQERNQSLKGRIFTGVEVDILGPDGELDIEDEALRQLDYVGASLHRDEWIDTTGEKPTVEGLLNAYMVLASHPAVDVINHPIRELPEEEWRKFEEEGNQYFERWREICQALARNGKAIEINLRDLIDPKREEQNRLYLKLIQEAKKAGVRFVLGTDFHRIEQYLQKGEGREKLEKLAKGDIFFKDQGEEFEEEIDQVLKEVFAEGEGAFGLPKNFVNLARPIYRAIRCLTEIGITPDDILNGDEERFREWINLRRSYKNSTPILEKELEKRGCVVRSIRSILDEQGLYYLGISAFERLSQLKTLDQWRDEEMETLSREGRDFGEIVKRVEKIANEAYEKDLSNISILLEEITKGDKRLTIENFNLNPNSSESFNEFLSRIKTGENLCLIIPGHMAHIRFDSATNQVEFVSDKRSNGKPIQMSFEDFRLICALIRNEGYPIHLLSFSTGEEIIKERNPSIDFFKFDPKDPDFIAARKGGELRFFPSLERERWERICNGKKRIVYPHGVSYPVENCRELEPNEARIVEAAARKVFYLLQEVEGSGKEGDWGFDNFSSLMAANKAMDLFLVFYTSRKEIEASSSQERIAEIIKKLTDPEFYTPILVHSLRFGENYPPSAKEGWEKGIELISKYFTDGLEYLSSQNS